MSLHEACEDAPASSSKVIKTAPQVPRQPLADSIFIWTSWRAWPCILFISFIYLTQIYSISFFTYSAMVFFAILGWVYMINWTYHSLDIWHMVWRRINKCFAVSKWKIENAWKQTSTSACSFKWHFSCHPSAGTMCCLPEYHQGTKENSVRHFYILTDLDCYRYLQQHVAEPN